MSSDLIKQMAARILATIKNQYPNSYNDNGKKEQIVRMILSKIDAYSRYINQQTAAQIVQKITKEIISDHPPDRKILKANYPQKPKANPQYIIGTSDRHSQAQFERGNLLSGRPTMISQRPVPTNNKTSNRQINRRHDDSFIPINRQTNDTGNDVSDNYDQDVSFNERVNQIKEERNKLFANARQRPPTPDFSLDGSGKKKKKQKQEQQVRQTRQQAQSKRQKFEHNPQANNGIIGVNELAQNNTGFSSFDAVEEGINNINIMNTGIDIDDPKFRKFNNKTSVNDRLKEIENGRNNNIVDKNHTFQSPSRTSVCEQLEEKKKSETTNFEGNDLYTLVDNHINNKLENVNPIPQQRPQEQINHTHDHIHDHTQGKILSELEEYKQVNSKLQNRLIELQAHITSTNQDEEQKITKLSQLKEEIIGKLEKLKNIQENNGELEKKINKIIGGNIAKFENGEETIIMCSDHIILQDPIKNVTSIELKVFDLPFDKYNITNNNNKLQFRVLENTIKQNVNDDNNDNDNNDNDDNGSDDDNDDLMDVDENDGNITLTVINGNYEIDTLITMLNKILIKYDITFTRNKSNILTLKSKNKFDLVFDKNTMFNNLGFTIQNKSKYTNVKKHVGSKPYDFKIDRYMNIYITNINETKSMMQYSLNSDKNQSKKIVFTPIIIELKELKLKFIGSKGKEFKFDSENGQDFEIHAIIKYINSNQNIIKNELNESISSEDELAIVKNSF